MRKYINKKRKYITDYPAQGKTIILLHGFLSSKKYWSKVGPLLNNLGYRVIAIDLLGFGDADKPKNNQYGYDEHLRHIRDTLLMMELKTDIILVGHSMGALLAMRFASEYPDGISQLALINPPMYKDEHQAATTLRTTNFLYRILLDSRFRHIFWIILRNIGPFASHTKHSREGSLSNVINVAYFFEDIDAVKIPTLLFIGKKDRAIYMDNLLQVGVGENINVTTAETGHHAPRTNAKLVVEQIVSFAGKNGIIIHQ
ncbi:MAG: alpha/beta fold hydrolase [Candidatus Saccharibacteria bacterium]|nr:alpha/beta fold hydrolase [Candidatus Saccharibacteria bacterium]